MNFSKLLIIILATMIYSIAFYGQENELGSRIILASGNLEDAKYHLYQPPFKAKNIYSYQTEASNLFPEQLMSSILSASNQEWVNYNTLGGEEESDKKSQEHFEEVKTMNVDQTFFELQSKLEFISNSTQMAIVKFYYHRTDNKPIAGAIVMQKEGNVWKTTSTPYTTNIAMALMVFKPDVFERLLLGKGINDMEKSLISNVYDKNGFSFEKLLKRKLSKVEKDYFTNPLNWKQ